jgi:hypothetical protein
MSKAAASTSSHKSSFSAALVTTKDTLTFRLHPKQLVAFRSKATEILYRGAAGGGNPHLMRAAATNQPNPKTSVRITRFSEHEPPLRAPDSIKKLPPPRRPCGLPRSGPKHWSGPPGCPRVFVFGSRLRVTGMLENSTLMPPNCQPESLAKPARRRSHKPQRVYRRPREKIKTRMHYARSRMAILLKQAGIDGD